MEEELMVGRELTQVMLSGRGLVVMVVQARADVVICLRWIALRIRVARVGRCVGVVGRRRRSLRCGRSEAVGRGRRGRGCDGSGDG